MCWHRFLTRVKEGDFRDEKVANSEETRRWTGLESADGSPSDEPEEYADPPVLVVGRWRVADEVKEGEEDPDSIKILMIRL